METEQWYLNIWRANTLYFYNIENLSQFLNEPAETFHRAVDIYESDKEICKEPITLTISPNVLNLRAQRQNRAVIFMHLTTSY